jgi:hypothetical protein
MTKRKQDDSSERDGDYKVGYRKPPKTHQFTPGQSGNPRGRPKGSKNLAADLREELSERIPVVENGKPRTLTKQRALLKAQVAKAISGDVRAAQTIVNMVAAYFTDNAESQTDKPPSPEDEEIIRLFLEQQMQGTKEGEPDDE